MENNFHWTTINQTDFSETNYMDLGFTGLIHTDVYTESRSGQVTTISTSLVTLDAEANNNLRITIALKEVQQMEKEATQ